jgi:hypothetical protein
MSNSPAPSSSSIWEEVADYALDWAAQKTGVKEAAEFHIRPLAEGDGFDLG